MNFLKKSLITILPAICLLFCACGGSGSSGRSDENSSPPNEQLPTLAGMQMYLNSGTTEYFYFVDTAHAVVKRNDGTEYDGTYTLEQNRLNLNNCKSRHGNTNVSYSGYIFEYSAENRCGTYRFVEQHSNTGSSQQSAQFTLSQHR